MPFSISLFSNLTHSMDLTHPRSTHTYPPLGLTLLCRNGTLLTCKKLGARVIFNLPWHKSYKTVKVTKSTKQQPVLPADCSVLCPATSFGAQITSQTHRRVSKVNRGAVEKGRGAIGKTSKQSNGLLFPLYRMSAQDSGLGTRDQDINK